MKMRNKNEAPSNGNTHNIMATKTTFIGNVFAENHFRLDGKLEGNVSCSGKVVIGEQGEVTGDVTADNAEILGKVDGNLIISNTLIVKASATVNGNIQTSILEIEPHATFNGSCKMVAAVSPSGSNE